MGGAVFPACYLPGAKLWKGKEEDRVREGNGTMQAEIRGGG